MRWCPSPAGTAVKSHNGFMYSPTDKTSPVCKLCGGLGHDGECEQAVKSMQQELRQMGAAEARARKAAATAEAATPMGVTPRGAA